jgi:hypothetical protein
MRCSWQFRAVAGAAALAFGLFAGRAPARAQDAVPASPWAGYATTRAAPFNAYASRPSAWSRYTYRGTAAGPVGASDLAPRKVAYGYRYNPVTAHWEHPGYGGRIPNYGHAARYTELPRPWLWWGAVDN